MKHRIVIIGCVVIAILMGIAVLARTTTVVAPHPAVNPDPNHIHADFAVWIADAQLDFSNDIYMSGSSTDESTHPHQGARQYIHLHDGNDHVIHLHKPGKTLGDAMHSLGLRMQNDCLTLDDYQRRRMQSVGKSSPASFADSSQSGELCSDASLHWQLFVNGREQPFDPSYTIQDLDQILLRFSSRDSADDLLKRQLRDMTDDACLYSRTCPERGAPPTENCIADPTVPCIAP